MEKQRETGICRFCGQINDVMKSVYAWELGKNNPRLPELIVLAEYYGASLDYIVFGR